MKREHLLLVLSAFAIAPAAVAQQKPASMTLEEIVVTAQKRVENAQDVPLAVATFNRTELQQRDVNSMVQLTNFVPNVQLTNSSQILSSPSMLSGFIRGIGQDDFSATFDPGVATYVDGVYLARTVGANVTLLDIERIEVLKGPQGTLFGRNTIGGAISVVTRDPSSTLGIQAEATIGGFNRIDGRVMADIPLIDDHLLSSIAFSSSTQDGYQRRSEFSGADDYATDSLSSFVTNGIGARATSGGIDEQNLRTKLLWKVSPGLRATLTADYTHSTGGASPSTLLKTYQTGPLAFGSLVGLYNTCINASTAILGASALGAICGPRFGAETALGGVNTDASAANDRLTVDNRFVIEDPDNTYATGNNFVRQENYGFAGTIDVALGNDIFLKSISAYRNLVWNVGADLDGTPVIVFEPSVLVEQHQFSQELQLNGKAFEERMDWLIGAYYFEENASEGADVLLGGALQQIHNPISLNPTSSALFTHVNFALTDRFSITAGVRYTQERKTFTGSQADLNQLLIKAGVPPFLFPDPDDLALLYLVSDEKQDFHATSPRLGVEYRPRESVMLYASYAEGYKSGGWTARLAFPVTEVPTFGPEKARTFEIGAKTEFLEHRLRVNLAAFTTTYDDIQLLIQKGESPTVINAGDARIRGLELELQTIVTGDLKFNASAGTVDAQYLSVDDPTGAIALSSDLPKTPNFTAHVGPEYRFYRGSGSSFTLRGDYSYRARAANDAENSPDIYSSAAGLLDISATYILPNDRWSFTAGGHNVFDKRYIINGANLTAFGVELATYNRPAEWYLAVRFNAQ